MPKLSTSSKLSFLMPSNSWLNSRLAAAASALLLSACSTVQVECPRLPPHLLKRPAPLNDLKMTGQGSHSPQTMTQPSPSRSAAPSTGSSVTN